MRFCHCKDAHSEEEPLLHPSPCARESFGLQRTSKTSGERLDWFVRAHVSSTSLSSMLILDRPGKLCDGQMGGCHWSTSAPPPLQATSSRHAAGCQMCTTIYSRFDGQGRVVCCKSIGLRGPVGPILSRRPSCTLRLAKGPAPSAVASPREEKCTQPSGVRSRPSSSNLVEFAYVHTLAVARPGRHELAGRAE